MKEREIFNVGDVVKSRLNESYEYVVLESSQEHCLIACSNKRGMKFMYRNMKKFYEFMYLKRAALTEKQQEEFERIWI